MPGEPTGRPLLPQTAQMQSFAFAPPALAPRENQRNYVFVDEHNRHKRLKVMRACEGCRRRKIKCDAATTNAWPCAACIRLKLNCVPPTVSYDKDWNANTQTFELETKPLEYAAAPPDAHHDFQRTPVMATPHGLHQQMPTPVTGTYADGGMRMYQTAPYMEDQSQDHLQYASMPPPQVVQQTINYAPPQSYSDAPPPAPSLAMTPPASEATWKQDPTATLTEALGELKIDHKGFAPYIANQKKALAETPAQEEFEVQLPPSTSLDQTVRIPQEMMPSEEQCLHYFDYYFTNVHPYLPIVSKAYFYQQWQSARDSISPLMLEAIFACASLMLNEDADGHKWLALASRHEESFKDVPRLSTMQAMILLLKAREASPKRGYFWRSWMTVVGLIAMAKDLELDEHYENHQIGRSCGSTPHECLTKTRVWQALFILETMIGGPQGRWDFGVQVDTVDFEMPRPVAGLDPSEFQISCQFIQFTRIVKNIQLTTIMHGKLKKKTADWALDPSFVGHNADFPVWLRELPENMQIVYPPDGSTPWIPSHFVANMHSYHHLGVIMHLRPQLHAVSDSYDGIWKQHMIACYSAAKNMCKLQEAVLKTYGLPGLLCMIRGLSFTIYSVLTCTMLHLVAITCPDPELNNDSREFFVRHMRILETVAPSWPMPDMHQQVNNLRQAFSADITKPFELKPSFPFGSPQVPPQSSPASNHGSYRPRLPSQHSPLDQPAQSLVMMASGQRAPQPVSGAQMQEPVQWNPQRIFDHWNTAFGNSYDLRASQDAGQPNYQISSVSPPTNSLQGAQAQLPAASYAPPNAPYVTPTMWQEVVASTFPDNLKRRWDQGNTGMVDHSMYKRAR